MVRSDIMGAYFTPAIRIRVEQRREFRFYGPGAASLAPSRPEIHVAGVGLANGRLGGRNDPASLRNEHFQSLSLSPAAQSTPHAAGERLRL